MKRTQFRLRLGFGLAAMVSVLALVAIMTMVSSNGGTTSVSAEGPKATPNMSDPKISVCIDAKVVGGAAWKANQIKALVAGANTIWGQARINITWTNTIDPVADPEAAPGNPGDIVDTWKDNEEFNDLDKIGNSAGKGNCVRAFFIRHFVGNDGTKFNKNKTPENSSTPQPGSGIITLAEVGPNGPKEGWSYVVVSIHAKDNSQTFAHELGHIFGLQHENDLEAKPKNLMAKSKVETNTVLNKTQINSARTVAQAISDQPTNPNEGGLKDINDLTVRIGPAGEEQFHCISRTDHDLVTNVIKTAAVCYINYSGAGDPATVETGRAIPCPSGGVPFCAQGDDEGVNCLGVLVCSDESAGDPIIGPPPPPPYGIILPQKGTGAYDSVGSSPECASITNAGNTPCSYVYSCFSDIGAGTLGPNLGTLVVSPNPKDTNPSPIAKVKLIRGITNDECDNLSFTVPGNLYGGLQLSSTSAADTSPVAWRTQNTGCQADYTVCDFDSDGCTDFDELAHPVAQPKGCGDDPWNPTDSNISDVSGAYDILIRVTRSGGGTANSNGGIYFSCLADIQQASTGKTDGDIVARAQCIQDAAPVVPFLGITSEINKLAYPGITGDGFPGGGPPWGAIPICVGTGNPAPNNCKANATSAQEVGEGETDCSRGPFNANKGNNPVALDEDNDGVANDGCPSEGFSDVDPKHTVLTGQLAGNENNILQLSGCFDDQDASSSIGDVYTELSINKNTGQGTVDIWTEVTQTQCDSNPAFGTFGTASGLGAPDGNFDDALAMVVRQPGGKNRDSDTDGIPNAVELRDDDGGGSTSNCGSRDPGNPYDWYDVNQDGVIDLVNDILGVIDHWQPLSGGAAPYDVIFDRPPTIVGAVGHWNRGAPDGIIDLVNDILGVIDQWHPLGC